MAIGKDGQNVRLAYKLTQYRIEIEGEGEPTKPAEKKENAEVAVVENEEAKAKEEIAEEVAADDAKPVVAGSEQTAAPADKAVSAAPATLAPADGVAPSTSSGQAVAPEEAKTDIPAIVEEPKVESPTANGPSVTPAATVSASVDEPAAPSQIDPNAVENVIPDEDTGVDSHPILGASEDVDADSPEGSDQDSSASRGARR